MKKKLLVASVVAWISLHSLSAQDPNFYIYLCFGQSNMEGQGTIENRDKNVDERFKVFQAMDCSNLNREKDTWYTAVPPTCQCWSGLSPADYFGRTMIENLPDSITVGIMNVAVGGCDIRLFDKDIYEDFDSTYQESWFTDKLIAYNWNPYQFLMDMAKKAQQDGVIKGILLHQGETNTGDANWPTYVKKIYNDMLTELSLDADSVPLLAGEVVVAEQNGCCSSMNEIINRLPDTIPSAHVISASDCEDKTDNTHFTAAGYRKLGRRYGTTMLSTMGYESVYLEAECGTAGSAWEVLGSGSTSNGAYMAVKNGIESADEAPTADSAVLQYNFTIPVDTVYHFYARLNCPSEADDSYWIKIDGGDYVKYDTLTTDGWAWVKLDTLTLTAGEHTLSIAYAEDGAGIDKIAFKNSTIPPSIAADEVANPCVAALPEEPEEPNEAALHSNSPSGYSLGQNYPNPFTDKTNIPFEIPQRSFVSLKIYDMLGSEIAELGGRAFPQGKHILEFDPSSLAQGNYFYTIKIDQYSASRRMVLQVD